MAKAPRRTPKEPRLNAANRKLFFAHMSETANVAASARMAGIDSSLVYAERRRSVPFCTAWSQALAEGYARLEANFLADALQPANGKTSDGTMKARAQKHRLGMMLLNVHRASVKTSGTVPLLHAQGDLRVLKTELLLKLTQMRERARIALEGPPPESAAPNASN